MSENKTLDNLMAAFAGESQANRKYLAYAKKAEKDGKINAAKLFRAASDAETLHALKHFDVAGKTGSTVDNLKDAVTGETHEYKRNGTLSYFLVEFLYFFCIHHRESNDIFVRNFVISRKNLWDEFGILFCEGI